jgi:hypothetical protein
MHASYARHLLKFLNFEMLVLTRRNRAHAMLTEQVAQTGTHHGEIEWNPLRSAA